ncbi:MAG: hydrolase or acyltransferase (alpha/beta hydrolase superfamily)-like protein [Candidatus Saccharibacteria bacterium]|nr:hydrolase or acyltransferase (alpha/beta hydrolase superfamily)-like protein [Candidatus Saccharibacteria bacterium]
MNDKPYNQQLPSTSPRHLRVPVADTVLDCNDSGGNGQPVIFLNGAFASQRDWKKVQSQLGGTYRTITYDERARGKSETSADYSFEGCGEDLAAVIKATGVQRPVLVGWSLGAAIAVRYAAEHPDDITALLLIDGAYPIAMFTDADKEQVRRSFRRMAFLLPILARFGKAARMSADQAADFNIELDGVLGKLGSSYDKISLPVYFICASKRSMGGTEAQFSKMRASVEPLVARHPNISIFKTLPCSHLEILSKYPATVAAAINNLASHATVA